MSRTRRRHPALARKIDAMTVPTKTPGIGIAIIGSDGPETKPEPTNKKETN